MSFCSGTPICPENKFLLGLPVLIENFNRSLISQPDPPAKSLYHQWLVLLQFDALYSLLGTEHRGPYCSLHRLDWIVVIMLLLAHSSSLFYSVSVVSLESSFSPNAATNDVLYSYKGSLSNRIVNDIHSESMLTQAILATESQHLYGL